MLVALGGALLLLLLLLSSTARGSTPSWLQRTAPWSPRDSIQAASNGTTAVAIGGKTAAGDSSEVWRFIESRWVLETGVAPFGPRHGGTTIVTDNSVFLIGGISTAGGSSRLKADVWRSSSAGRNWTDVSEAQVKWSPRSAACGAVHSNRLWLLGGFDFSPTQGVFASKDLTGESWDALPSARWSRRGLAACASFRGELFVAGGSDLAATLGDMYSTTDGTSWELVTPAVAGWTPRAGASLVMAANLLFLAGGSPAGRPVLSTVNGRSWELVESSNAWSTLTDAPVVSIGLELAVLGGLRTDTSKQRNSHLSDGFLVTTDAFFCQNNGVECSGHGVCVPDLLRREESAVVDAGIAGSEAAVSIAGGFHCSCAEGWAPPDCATAVCSPINCVHGACVPATHDLGGNRANWASDNSTAAAVRLASDGQTPLVCVCSAGWQPPTCVQPVCRDGCDAEHGTCTAPGHCDCNNGWRGVLCNRQETIIEALGAWVRARAATVYGVVTALGIAAATAYGSVANYWLRRPLGVRGKLLPARGRHDGQPPGSKSPRHTSPQRFKSYGATGDTAGQATSMLRGPRGWTLASVAGSGDGFTPARDSRPAPMAHKARGQPGSAAVGGAGAATLSGGRFLGARTVASDISGAGSDTSSLLASRPAAPAGRAQAAHKQRTSNPFGL